MCGIAGYIAPTPMNGPAMVQELLHRGPDGQGSCDAFVAGKHVYLGHTRLAIIDRSDAGAQPMSDASGTVTIVYNGEVYNYLDLKRRFLADVPFTSRTDTEVVLHLYRKLGPEFVRHLNGDFSMAILDERSGMLYLYRDRLGVKPCYYYASRDRLLFGSEIKSILAAGPGVSVSEDAIQQYFVFKYVPEDRTLFSEIRRLTPGSYLAYDIGRAQGKIHQYWQPPVSQAAPNRSYEELKEELFDLLHDAVRIRLMADVPLGNFLSGGVDSSTIAYFLRDEDAITHYCARKASEDLKEEGTSSDFAYATRLARDWDLHLEAADIGRADATHNQIRRVLHFSDDLIADGSQIPSYLISGAASTRCKVMLSGMGADELFLGYGAHALALGSLYLDRLPRSVSTRVAGFLGRVEPGNGTLKAYRRWLHKFGRHYADPRLRYAKFSVVGDFATSLGITRIDSAGVYDLLGRYFDDGSDPFEALTRFEMRNFLVKNLHYFDRMCMANGVEGRVPFMDHRIVEFALRLPRSYKLSAFGKTKRILKETMAPVLPSYVVYRRKAGFGMPLRSILRSEGTVRALLDLDVVGGLSFIDVDHVRGAVRAHLDGVEDNSSILYALICFQEWYRMFHANDAVVCGS